jgi:hypothetical protein
MSAFIVTEQTIHDTVQAFIRHMPTNRAGKTPDEIGAHLIRMNAEAVRQRYAHIPDVVQECAEATAEADDYAFVEPRHLTSGQMLTSATCLLYQCSEGDIETTWPAFADLHALVARLKAKCPGAADGEWDRSDDAPPRTIDFRVDNHGSLLLLRPLHRQSKEWLHANLDCEAQWFGGAVAVQPRYMEDLRHALEADGFVIEWA